MKMRGQLLFWASLLATTVPQIASTMENLYQPGITATAQK
jgi:hypothetical protein